MTHRTTPAYELDCPRDDCEGVLRFWEESTESYTNNGLSVWAHSYLVMDGASCSDGHSFDEDEIKQFEADALEAAQDDSWRY